MLAPIGALDTQLALSGKRITPELVLGLGFTHKMHVPSALGRARGSLKVARSTDGRDGEGRGGARRMRLSCGLSLGKVRFIVGKWIVLTESGGKSCV